MVRWQVPGRPIHTAATEKSNVPGEPFEGNNDEKGTKKEELERKHGQPIQTSTV